MKSGDIWLAVHQERQALHDDLQTLEPEAWNRSSLCSGWDVHDVMAHLVDSAKTSRLSFIRRMIMRRFDFDGDNADGINRERRASGPETLAEFQRVLHATATPPANLATRLVEIIVHGEDIRRPLGLHRSYPALPVVTALKYQLTTGVSMGGGKQRARGLRLVATDADFNHGDGPEVSGAAIALLLAVSARPVNDGELTGAGAPTLRQAATP